VHRLVELAPGSERPYDPAEWRDAIVTVQCGELELVGVEGTCLRLGTGAVLWLAGLPLLALRNPSEGPTLINSVSRRSTR
jgi:hypothetical protein